MILRQKKGFTLIEMLVVILIIVILITIAVPAVAGYRAEAQETADMAAVKTVFNALESAATFVHPSVLTGGVREGTLNDYTRKNYNFQDPTDDEFGQRIMEYVGNGFEGYFRFGYYAPTGSIRWISYWSDDDIGSGDREGVMVYDVEHGLLGYLDDLADTYTGIDAFEDLGLPAGTMINPDWYGPASSNY